MGLPKIHPKPLARWFIVFGWFLSGAVASAAGEKGGTFRPIQNIFDPLSTPAESIRDVALLTCGICAAIFLIVGTLIVYATLRFRSRSTDDRGEPPQIYGSLQIELAWTVIPVVIVFSLVLVTSRMVVQIQGATLPKDALEVRLVGHQWWWEVHYPAFGVVTANEIHVPLSSDRARKFTRVVLDSADVIHSFWVPQLAGKTDVIPNHRNETWIEPKAEGTYLGDCAEYCGTQHANMLLRVVVESPAEFAAWIAAQKASPETIPAVAQGKNTYLSLSCVSCHAIGSTVSKGAVGPNLTHLMSRQTIGAGVEPLNPETLRRWLRNPQEVKPGCSMPNMQLSETQVGEIATYLETLK